MDIHKGVIALVPYQPIRNGANDMDMIFDKDRKLLNIGHTTIMGI